MTADVRPLVVTNRAFAIQREPTQPGDVNLDYDLDLTDAVVLLGDLFLGEEGVVCPPAADFNEDGEVNISDPIGILQHLASPGAAGSSPHTASRSDSLEHASDASQVFKVAFVSSAGYSLEPANRSRLETRFGRIILGVDDLDLHFHRVLTSLYPALTFFASLAQHAAWCDYSGPVPLAPPAGGEGKKRQDGDSLPAAIVGISCFDHPENGEGKRQWHVRDDGWMGPSLTRSRPRTVTGERPLRLRYRLEAHLGRPWNARVGDRYRLWRR